MATTKDGRTIDVERDPTSAGSAPGWVRRAPGEAEFRPTPDPLAVFTHTEVNPAFEGQGIGLGADPVGPRRRP